MNNELEMKFDPNVISHLGVQMYSTLPPVISELISNAYDAEAENVKISLFDIESEKKIIIEDDGHGMTVDEINKKFLIVGRDRRKDEGTGKSKNGKRHVIGRKGIGKLAFFGIAEEAVIETYQNNILNSFEMSWSELCKQGKEERKYNPKLIQSNASSPEKNKGTKIILTKIKRKSSFDSESLAYSLAQTFQIFDEPDFKVEIYHNGSQIENSPLKNELRYRDIDVLKEWNFPLPNNTIKSEYKFKNDIKGKIIASKDKTVPEKMKGIALFSRGKLVNNYSFYDLKVSSHGYSYITGWLNVDFIENFEDVISTNRQSLNWETEDTGDLKIYLQDIIKSFYNEQKSYRETSKKEQIKNNFSIDIDKWLETLPKHEKKLASKICNIVLSAEGIDSPKAGELIKYTQDSFQFEAFKELASEIDNDVFKEPQKIIYLFKEWQLIESREMYKIASVRLETIRKFERHIDSNAKEVPDLHKFLKQFPWILDPRIMNFRDEVTYSSLLKEHFKEDMELDENKRIDFLCVDFSESFFIIELKRPKTIIGEKQLDQGLEYVSFLENKLGNEHGRNIYCYVLGNKLSGSNIAQKKAESYKKSGSVYFKPYSELLKNAKNYHQEFIDKYETIVHN